MKKLQILITMILTATIFNCANPSTENPDGTKPVAGDEGTNGVDGVDGDKGDKGDKGDNGQDGTNGIDGTKGDKGDKGDNGDNGRDGTNGIDGMNGQDLTRCGIDYVMFKYECWENGNFKKVTGYEILFNTFNLIKVIKYEISYNEEGIKTGTINYIYNENGIKTKQEFYNTNGLKTFINSYSSNGLKVASLENFYNEEGIRTHSHSNNADDIRTFLNTYTSDQKNLVSTYFRLDGTKIFILEYNDDGETRKNVKHFREDETIRREAFYDANGHNGRFEYYTKTSGLKCNPVATKCVATDPD